MRAERGAAKRRLRCLACGLTYSQAAIAREMTLAVGVSCRRCGGALEEHHEEPPGRTRVVAVRSPIAGSNRLPVG